MRFTVERKTMLSICRNFIRFVPEKSPVEDLTGILMEADENRGSIHMTATDMEITVQYDCQASVGEGGKMLLNASLLAEIMRLLGEDLVMFATLPGGRIVHIQSGKAEYTLSYLSGAHYPKPQVPLPENMVRVSGLGRLAKQTTFAAKKKSDTADILTNVKLEVFPTAIHAVSTDTSKLALVRHKQSGNGRLDLLVPASSLSLLAGMAGDDVLDVGMSGSAIVFAGPNFVFSTRTMQGTFMDTNALIKSIQTEYDAVVNARDFQASADILETITDCGSLIHLVLRKGRILLSSQSEHGTSQTQSDAVVYTPTPAGGFHYSASNLFHALRHMDGNIRLSIDKGGTMLLKGTDQLYLITPRRPKKVAVNGNDKPRDKKKKTAKAA